MHGHLCAHAFFLPITSLNFVFYLSVEEYTHGSVPTQLADSAARILVMALPHQDRFSLTLSTLAMDIFHIFRFFFFCFFLGIWRTELLLWRLTIEDLGIFFSALGFRYFLFSPPLFAVPFFAFRSQSRRASFHGPRFRGPSPALIIVTGIFSRHNSPFRSGYTPWRCWMPNQSMWPGGRHGMRIPIAFRAMSWIA